MLEDDVKEYAGYILRSQSLHVYFFPEDIRHEMLGPAGDNPPTFSWIYGVVLPEGGGKIVGMIERRSILHLYSDGDKLTAALDEWGRDWSVSAWIKSVEFHD